MHRDVPGCDKIESGKYVVSDEDAGGFWSRETSGLTAFGLEDGLVSASCSNTQELVTSSNALDARRKKRGRVFITVKGDGTVIAYSKAYRPSNTLVAPAV